MSDLGPKQTHKQTKKQKNKKNQPKLRLIKTNRYTHPIFPSFIGNCLITIRSEDKQHKRAFNISERATALVLQLIANWSKERYRCWDF